MIKHWKENRVCRLLGLGGVGLFLASAFSPLAHGLDLWFAAPPELVPSDAIVVLASGGASRGVLSPRSAVRALRGIALHRRGLAPLVVFSGGAAVGEQAEAVLRADLARTQGVPADAILIETEARTTQEEALRQKALLQPRGVRTILLVTNGVHLLRARPVFERAGFTVRPAPSDVYHNSTNPESHLDDMREVVMDLLAFLYYRVAGFL